jgi:flagellar hook-associated protein 1 FlgK
MGLLDSLRIGTSALLTQQAALQVTGNNIANVSTPGYAREEPMMAATGTSNYGAGITGGAGVKLEDVRRIVDDSLQQTSQYQVAQQTLQQVESLFNAGTDTDLSSKLTALFNGFSQLVGDSANTSQRGVVISQAQEVVTELHRQAAGLQDLSSQLTDRMNTDVQQVNQLASNVAALNTQIVSTESDGATATSLRDQRDVAISDLSKLVSVTAREQSNGAVTLYLGSQPLVDQGDSRKLMLATSDENGVAKQIVSFADNQGPVQLNGGEIAGIQTTRDGQLAQVQDRLSTLAGQLIWQVNLVHSQGTGLEGVHNVTAANQVADPSAALSSAQTGLHFRPTNGSFFITVTTASPGVPVTSTPIQIDVSQSTSLEDLTQEINDKAAGVGASIDAAGRLTLSATDPNATLSFGPPAGASANTPADTSHTLAALGINTFFTGTDAGSIALQPDIADLKTGPARLAAGLTGAPGDGANAQNLANLGTQTPVAALGNVTLTQYQQQVNSDLAVWTAAARDTATSNQVVQQALTAQRDSLSGVSLDEEAVNLMQYQRAFQGAARFITVVDQMLQTLLAIPT